MYYEPVVLDLFCGAGGASMGYHRAGFEVVGVDICPQPNYPFTFIQTDAIEYLTDLITTGYIYHFDLIHASPPCQRFTTAQNIRTDAAQSKMKHPDLVTPVRNLFLSVPTIHYVIENVTKRILLPDQTIRLCGTQFGLKLIRHRWFETNWPLEEPPHEPHQGSVQNGDYVGVYGMGGAMWADKEKTYRRKGSRKTQDWREVMQMPQASRYELTQAIPPAYTEYIGYSYIDHLF